MFVQFCRSGSMAVENVEAQEFEVFAGQRYRARRTLFFGCVIKFLRFQS